MYVKPLYDIAKSYQENLKEGPLRPDPMPVIKPLPKDLKTTFLDLPADSPLGVPAGPLLNSAWITLAAELGFDILTYKTIRSEAHPGHPLPNILFVSPSKSGAAEVCTQPPSLNGISITNSFGMPSMSPDYLLQDIHAAKQKLKAGKILIVSVVGTKSSKRSLAEDFACTARLAKEAGADAIEANFSCPNVSTKEGSLYSDPETASAIASCIADAIHPLPLLIKIGYIEEEKLLERLLIALAKANVRAVAGINSVSMQVLPPLGKGRETSGICGSMIREKALAFVRQAASLIQKNRLDLELAGCGGIMEKEHFDAFLNAGANAALTATGMMWDPFLAAKWRQTHG